MKSKKAKVRENENEKNAPSFKNFKQYFEEFYKMFNHCKYNLVALNKKFDALDMFFKNYNLKDKNLFDEEDTRDYEPNNRSISRKNGSNRKNISNLNYDDSNHDTKTEKEENFPISIEDLDYLTKNFITEEINGNSDERVLPNYKNVNKISSTSRKKKNQTENVITIKKKDVELDESLVEFFGRNNIEEEEFKELPVQLDKNTENNFVQKLFDYKTFSQSIKKTDIQCFKEKENSELNLTNEMIGKESDNSKWISRNEVDLKSSETNEENFKVLSADLTLSLVDKMEGISSQPDNKFDNKIQTEDSHSNRKKNYSEFSNFMIVNKLSLKKKFVPNVITRDEENNITEINHSQIFKDNDIQKFPVSDENGNDFDEGEDLYSIRPRNSRNNTELLKKKQSRTKNDCEACKKIIKDENDLRKIKCKRCNESNDKKYDSDD